MDQINFPTVLPEGYNLHWYEVRSLLGRGAFGITYLAIDNNLSRHVAIKEYLPSDFAARQNDSTVQPLSRDKGDKYKWGLTRFLKEARTLAKFNHPNIISVVSVFEMNNTAYMVMEYEQGDDLSIVIKKQQQFNQKKLLEIVLPLLDGIALVHASGFVHRDIKPSNIYIRKDGTPVLLDFGSARQKIHNTNNMTGVVTKGFAPLEQYEDDATKQGAWTDIYALGATLYYCVTGTRPVDAITRGANILSSGHDPYRPVGSLTQGAYEPNFLYAIDSALQFKAEDRPQNTHNWKKMLIGEVAGKRQRDLLEIKPELYRSLEKTLTNIHFNLSDYNSNFEPTISDSEDQQVASKINVNTSSKSTRAHLSKIEISPDELRKPIEPKRHWTFIPALILIIISLMFVYFIEKYNPIDFHLPSKNLEIVANQNDSLIDSYLSKAQRAVVENRTLRPERDNALYYYSKIVEINPSHGEAGAQMQKIIQQAIEEAQQNIVEKNFSKVEESIRIIQAFASNPTSATDLLIDLQLAKNKMHEQKSDTNAAQQLPKNINVPISVENQTNDAGVATALVAKIKTEIPVNEKVNTEPQPPQNLSPVEFFNFRGKQFVANKQYEKAEEEYSKAISIDKSYLDSYYNRGLLYGELSKYDSAITDFSTILELDSREISAYKLRGRMHFNLKNYATALQDYNTAISLSSVRSDLYILRGELYSTLGQYDKSMLDYNHVISIDPKLTEAYYSRGRVNYKLGKLSKALEDFSKAIDLDKNFSVAYRNRADLYERLHLFSEALKDRETLLELIPNSSSVKNDLAWFLATCGDDKTRNGPRALELAQHITRQSNDPRHMETLAAAYAETKDFAMAVRSQQNAISMYANQGFDDVELVKKLETRLQLFKSNQAIHDGR